MGLRVYGIGAAQCPDNIGETILLEGLDDSRLKGVKDEHPDEPRFIDRIGAITYHKKIWSEKDCENEYQKKCWRFAQVPFLYAEAELADDEDHENAKAAAAMIRFSSRPDIPLEVGFSVDGGIIERRDLAGRPTEDKEKGKILARTLATDLATTVKPCNPKCKLWMFNDLTKSDLAAPAPAMYLAMRSRAGARSSFRETIESNQLKLLFKVDKLKKSLSDYFGAFTSVKCGGCGHGIRFFKSGNVPNACPQCSKPFSMRQLWKSLNK